MLTELKQYYKSENDSRCSMIKNCFKTHKWVELTGNFAVVLNPKFCQMINCMYLFLGVLVGGG